MVNFAQNFIAGQQLGRERRLQDEALAKQNQLARLAGDALSAPAEGRSGYIAEIARLDPNTALTLQQTFGRQDESRQEAELGRARSQLAFAMRAQGPARDAAYGQLRSFAASRFGAELPEMADDNTLAALNAALGGEQQGAQSAQRAYVEWMASQIPENERGEFFRVQAGLAPKAQNQQFSPQRIEQADGSVRIDLVPTRGGNVAGGAPRPAGGMAPRASSGMDSIIAQANAMAQSGVPEADIERYIAGAARQSGIAVTPAGMDAAANRTLDAQTYGTAPPSTPAPAAGGQATNETRAAAAAAAAAAKVRAEEQARASVQREIDAPKTIEEGERLIGYIDAIISDPNRELVTGGSGVFNPLAWPGVDRVSGAADTKLRVAQVQGNAFLQAFESLKGGGAITEIEGQKAEQAIARLSTAQSDEGFLKALQDFRAAIAPGIERARRRAAGGEQEAPAIPDGARLAPDGNYYIQQGGRWFRVEQ